MVEQLVKRIRQKDQRAMNQFYQMYVEELSSVCYRYVPTKSDAKDVLQNSFVKIFTKMQTFEYRDKQSFEGFLVKVVVNEALCFLRERKRLMFVNLDEALTEETDDEEPKPERITADELHLLIRELPDGYRTVVNLHVFEGYSHQKIADLLGITASTSASQLYFAKRLLAKKIKALMNERR
jgi:RNA polymerase sigma-70 factor (ECF subfamily)